MKKLLVALLLIASHASHAADPVSAELKLDIQQQQNRFNVIMHQGDTPLLRCWLYTGGDKFNADSNWFGLAAFGTNYEDSTSMAIVAANVNPAATNFFDFQFSSADVNTNGIFFAQVMMTNATGTRRFVWKDGTFNIKKNPMASTANPIVWTRLPSGVNNGDMVRYDTNLSAWVRLVPGSEDEVLVIGSDGLPAWDSNTDTSLFVTNNGDLVQFTGLTGTSNWVFKSYGPAIGTGRWAIEAAAGANSEYTNKVVAGWAMDIDGAFDAGTNVFNVDSNALKTVFATDEDLLAGLVAASNNVVGSTQALDVALQALIVAGDTANSNDATAKVAALSNVVVLVESDPVWTNVAAQGGLITGDLYGGNDIIASNAVVALTFLQSKHAGSAKIYAQDTDSTNHYGFYLDQTGQYFYLRVLDAAFSIRSVLRWDFLTKEDAYMESLWPLWIDASAYTTTSSTQGLFAVGASGVHGKYLVVHDDADATVGINNPNPAAALDIVGGFKLNTSAVVSNIVTDGSSADSNAFNLAATKYVDERVATVVGGSTDLTGMTNYVDASTNPYLF